MKQLMSPYILGKGGREIKGEGPTNTYMLTMFKDGNGSLWLGLLEVPPFSPLQMKQRFAKIYLFILFINYFDVLVLKINFKK